jgi:hypothetical protein
MAHVLSVHTRKVLVSVGNQVQKVFDLTEPTESVNRQLSDLGNAVQLMLI